jgi:hypothetical protein
VKSVIFKYRKVSKAAILLVLFVFSFTSIAADSYNCICKSKQEVKKEMKCCSVKKESTCCGKEKSCGSHQTGNKKDCSKCTVKKSDIENPISTNDVKLVKTANLNLTQETLSINSVVNGLIVFNSWRPPDKTGKLYLELSNFRI